MEAEIDEDRSERLKDMSAKLDKRLAKQWCFEPVGKKTRNGRA